MHAEKAGGQVSGGANLIGGFVWLGPQDKHVVLDQAWHGVRPIAFLTPVEEMDTQVLSGQERYIDITKAPFHVEAVIVSESILNTPDDIVTGAQCHIELVDLILRHMELNLGIRVADIGRIETEVIDHFGFWT